MTLNQARRLRRGTLVHCPSDRGDPAYMGVVRGVDLLMEYENINGVPYVLVEVQHPDHGTHHVWPSNRLG